MRFKKKISNICRYNPSDVIKLAADREEWRLNLDLLPSAMSSTGKREREIIGRYPMIECLEMNQFTGTNIIISF